MKKLTVYERLEWAKKNTNIDVEVIKNELYSASFNHPYYGGGIYNDDELRHEYLDKLNIPQFDDFI